jgi:hypothetical protein
MDESACNPKEGVLGEGVQNPLIVIRIKRNIRVKATNVVEILRPHRFQGVIQGVRLGREIPARSVFDPKQRDEVMRLCTLNDDLVRTVCRTIAYENPPNRKDALRNDGSDDGSDMATLIASSRN